MHLASEFLSCSGFKLSSLHTLSIFDLFHQISSCNLVLVHELIPICTEVSKPFSLHFFSLNHLSFVQYLEVFISSL